MRTLTRQQWVGVGLLLLMVAAVEIFVQVVLPQKKEADLGGMQDGLLLNMADSLSSAKLYSTYRQDTIWLCLQPFDPNTADSATLVHLGLKPWQAGNMLRYRAKGGKYRRAEDMRRLYGMTDSLYAVLLPYIAIDSSSWCETVSMADTVLLGSYKGHPKRDTIIELNAADTFSLQYIRGIGPATARAIISYRDALGGYADTSQLREIPHYNPSIEWAIPFDTILPHLTVCKDSVHTIAVNKASVRRLARHPYIRFEEARAIYTLRRNRFVLHGMDELRAIPTLSDSLLLRLEPYLSFQE
ncbi:MAG: helix-hairpin-helix domain-containing protein [Paludibacteraceae bacterium]